MSKVPEGVETCTGEGRDVMSAVRAAAEALGVGAEQVAHVIDMSHFRTAEGGMIPRDTVKVIAWADPDGASARIAAASAASSSDGGGSDRREGSERRERRERPERRERESNARSDDAPRHRRGAEGETTEASAFAQSWFEVILEHLGVPGTVAATGTEGRVHVQVLPTDKAGRLIGRRGSTLGAVRQLLLLSVDKFGVTEVDIDVDDAGERDGGRDRNDRRERRGRRGDRDEGRRDRDDGRGRERRESGAGLSEDKLRALARRAAEKALETGKPITINLPLSSYERRIVHVEVGDIDGVATRSIEKDDRKVVQVLPE